MNNDYYGYQPYASYMPQPRNFAPTYNPMQPNNIQISYTNGLTGAKGYSIPPLTTMFLMDSDAPQFYIKTSDRNGMCTIKAYKFEEIAATEDAAKVVQQPSIDTSNFVTKEEFNNTIQHFAQLLQQQQQSATTAAKPAQNTNLI